MPCGMAWSLVPNGCKVKHGVVESCSVATPPCPALEVGDRLEPSPTLPDIGKLTTAQTPCTFTFWRTHHHGKSIIDLVVHRCPLFNVALHTSPTHTVVHDSLHTLYFGPIMRWTSAALQRVLQANPWGLRGTIPARRDIGCRRLSAEMGHYFETNAIPNDRRLSELTYAMLGGAPADDDAPHPGCAMSVKAAEVGVLLDFAVSCLRVHALPANFLQLDLLRAGEAMQRWLGKSCGLQGLSRPILSARGWSSICGIIWYFLAGHSRTMCPNIICGCI